MEFFPYLHSASPKLEYRSVSCPDFLWNEDGREFLSKAGVYTSQTCPVQWVTATHPTEGKIGILYRIRFAEARDIGQDGTDLLKDGAGRRIAATHGLIVKNPDPDFIFTEQHLAAAEQATRKQFAEFFVTGRDPGWPDSKVVDQTPIDLALNMASPPLSYVERNLDERAKTLGQTATETPCGSQEPGAGARRASWEEHITAGEPRGKTLLFGIATAVLLGGLAYGWHRHQVHRQESASRHR